MTNMKFPADLVTFTDVILIEKFLFCAAEFEGLMKNICYLPHIFLITNLEACSFRDNSLILFSDYLLILVLHISC